MPLPTEADHDIGEIDILLSLVLGKLKNMRFCIVPVPNERRAKERLRTMQRYRSELREALQLLANQTLGTADQWLSTMMESELPQKPTISRRSRKNTRRLGPLRKTKSATAKSGSKR